VKLSLKKVPFHLSLGDRGEMIAWDYLLQNGFKLLEKNYRCKIGEIDVIAIKKKRIHIIEIKTRAHNRRGRPEEAVGPQKQQKLIRLAEWYFKTKNQMEVPVSFDVLAIMLPEDGPSNIRFIEDAFRVDQVPCER